MNHLAIENLLEVIDGLDAADRTRFGRVFEAWKIEGSCKCVPSMVAWAQRYFGSVETIESQTVIRVQNIRTCEGALFNGIRALRPTMQTTTDDVLDKLSSKYDRLRACTFCNVRETTPVDSFAPQRIEGDHCVTASNAAKYDGRHGLIIFNNHDPLAFLLDDLRDYMEVANKWFRAATDIRQNFIYPFLIWNCGWRAGGSQEHGHMQVTLAQGRPYPRIESLRRTALAYRKDFGDSYFSDLFEIHTTLGLGFHILGKRILVSLCPFRDKEIWIMGRALDAEMTTVLYAVLATLRDQAGVRSFNLGVLFPPVVPSGDWNDFPVIIRIIDRLSAAELPSDISGMAIFAGADAIASDPFIIASLLKKAFPLLIDGADRQADVPVPRK